MFTIKFKEKIFEVDKDGFLLDYTKWCGEWVEHVRIQEGIEDLTDDHFTIMKIIQDFYEKNNEPPMVREFSLKTNFKLITIYELFPSGPGRGACKMAGLPKPKGCT